MRRTWLALMGAAERCYRDAGGHREPDNPADPYMTIVGYFNSLRELGGARRILALIVVEFIALVTVCGDNSVSRRVVAGNKPLAEMWA